MQNIVLISIQNIVYAKHCTCSWRKTWDKVFSKPLYKKVINNWLFQVLFVILLFVLGDDT